MATTTLIDTTDPTYPIRAGALALQALLNDIKKLSEETIDLDAGVDRDYFEITQCVARSLKENLAHPDPAHREGYLRVLTECLCITSDEVRHSDNFDAIKTSAHSFEGRARCAASGERLTNK